MMFSKIMQKNFCRDLAKILQLFEEAEETLEKNLDTFVAHGDVQAELRTLAGDIHILATRLQTTHARLEDMGNSAAERWLAQRLASIIKEETATLAVPLAHASPALPWSVHTLGSVSEEDYDAALIQLYYGIRQHDAKMEADARHMLNLCAQYVPHTAIKVDFKKIKRRASIHINYSNRLKNLLGKHRPLDKKVVTFWEDVVQNYPWFMATFLDAIHAFTRSYCENPVSSDGETQAQAYVRSVEEFYDAHAPSESESLLELLTTCVGRNAFIVPITQDHRIQCLAPETAWTLYIDETGQDFGKKTHKKRLDAKVVGLLLPENTPLRTLGASAHCAAKSTAAVLQLFNELMACKCGILGLRQRDLHPMKHDPWLASVQELIAWVWRLLPLREGEPVRLRVCIENRCEYSAEQDIALLKKIFEIQREKEDPARSLRLKVTSMKFVSKGTECIGWADVAAYMWGSSSAEIQDALTQSGLRGTCYLSDVADILPLWEKVFTGEMLSGDAWQRLMQEETEYDSITYNALLLLQERVMKDVKLCRPYVEATVAHLKSTTPDSDTLERQCTWLARIGQSKNLTQDMQFLRDFAEPDANNHKFCVTPHAGTFRESMGVLLQCMTQVRCKALRTAKCYAKIFDFSGARRCLAPWDFSARGRSVGSGIWDGKILSDLGQYTACEGDFTKALQCFDRASALFEHLGKTDGCAGYGSSANPLAHAAVVRIYAAMVAMDMTKMSQSERVQRVEQALGESILAACHKYARHGISVGRYMHHILVRYLSDYGSTEERTAYFAGVHSWCVEGVGMGQGHPWHLIQWYRWCMLTERMQEKMQNEKAALMNTLFGSCWPSQNGVALDILGIAVGIASHELQIDDAKIRLYLHDLAQKTPTIREKVSLLLTRAHKGPALVKAVVPCMYR